MLPDPISQSWRFKIAELALKHRLPVMYGLLEHVEAGGLMAYGADIRDNCRRGGALVGKILKRAEPGGLPRQLPTEIGAGGKPKTPQAPPPQNPPSLPPPAHPA